MAEVGNLQVNIGLNSSGFQQGINNINRQLKVAQAEFRNASSALGGFGNSTEQLRTKANYLNQSVQLQKQKVEELKRAYESSVQATGEDSRATQNLAVQYNNAQARLNNLQGQLNSTNEKIKLQESRWTQLGTNLSNVGSKMQTVGKKMQDIGSNLTTKVTAPILAVGTAAAKMSMDFGDSIAKVSTIADTSEVSIGDLRKGILKLSDDTGIASSEIADNVYDAISAGQKTGDAVNFVSNSTKLAKAGFAEAGQSLDLLTTIMNSYGLKANEVNNVSDILIQTQNKGKVTVAELSSSMGKVIPTANSMGVNLEQVASGYAIMTSKGIKAAETTTYMNSMFNEMGKGGTTANKAIKEASGKTFPELIASGKTVGDVLNIMNDYAKKNGKSLADMFGSAEAGKAALILSGNQGKDFNAMLESMKKSAGATDEAFKKVNDTAGTRLKNSFNKLKNAGIQLGDTLAPMIEKISGVITILASKFSSLTPAQQEIIMKIGLLVAAIGPVILTIGKLITIGGTLVSAFGTISTAVGSAGGVIALLTSPIGIAIGAITAIIAIGVLLYENWDTIKAKCEELKNNLVNIWNSIKTFITNTINTIKTTTTNIWNTIKSTTTTVFNAIKQFLNVVWNGYKVLITLGLNAIKSVVTTVWNAIKTVTQTVWNGIKTYFTTLWNIYKTIFTTALNAIKSVVTTVWNALKSTTTTVFNSIKTVVTSVWNGIKSVVNNVVNSMKSMISSAWNGIKSTTASIWNSIKTAIENPINRAKDTVKRVLDTIKGFFSSLKIPEIKIPKIKLPHFNLTGSFSLNPPSVPKLGVNWYDKGGIFDRPSIIGVGEKRPEFVGALDDLRYLIRDELNNSKSSNNGGTLNVTIENFVNNRKQDVQSFAEELEFYRKQNSLSRGGAY